MKKWTMILLTAFFAIVSANSVFAADYVGSKKCKMCHMKQFKSWQETKMAKAFEGLKPGASADAKTAAGLDPNKDYSTDANCLGCHAVNGKADMPGVQCEACHGPGSDYAKVMMKNKEFKRDEITAVGFVNALDSCKNCHNDKSPFYKEITFDKDKGLHAHFPMKYQH
jgi:hypothetical protein